MYWRTEPDVFTFSTAYATDVQRPTKRQALRVVMSPFDPIGVLCFFLIHGKIFIQELWRAKTDWDELIPEALCERWVRWTEKFQFLDQIKIPRCYFGNRTTQEIETTQLHIFVDASEDAYACVAYIRAVVPNEIEMALVGGKAKVAPLKVQSIPRLELMAAVIGVRLAKTIVKEHTLRFDEVIFWSDSKTVMAWIHSDHRKYRQFVACRVGEILLKSEATQWRWIPTKENVADDATKWGKGPCLSSNNRWFQGPSFLHQTEKQWPSWSEPAAEPTTEELRACMFYHVTTAAQAVDWKRFSSWMHLLKSVAYGYRFSRNLKQKAAKQKVQRGLLTQDELVTAEQLIFSWVQWEQYPDEMTVLSGDQKVPTRLRTKLERTSRIRTLSPYVDEFGVLRSDSRIAAARYVAYDTRYPVILPKEHIVTRLLVSWYHQEYLHANVETVVNELRQRFHISKLRSLVREVGKGCMKCKIKKAVPMVPRMAPLPAARLQAFTRPFSYVGVDFFGPIAVRVNRSINKRWIALFTCMTTRAVHLEVVHTLTTESCKMAIRRFIGRRGAPVEVRSDRGTNFVGSSNELLKEMNEINSQLAETFTNVGTRWVFNPPGAPHMGGALQRLVRSVKTALAASRVPSEETLATLVAEAESVVNSRPLTYIPLETEQQEALTPNHFLLLNSSGVVQTPKNLSDPKLAGRAEWNLCQVMLDAFWRRWVREYLPTIARRTKWFEEVPPIGVGDIVVVVEEKVRNGWIRGRVVETKPGRDGRVSSAVVQTGNGLVHRPVSKLARLDLETDSGESKAEEEPALRVGEL
ncbi:uncharacterized protein LOC129733051 [Wyeomyia smithii]|uniref:uncharacterized protein LOC129733051 n=1 Tax=Wyeomyia smithii TaxID=174621 RepID=UPI002467FCAC|nr:uncharacterized protein LOC129733051 [Wyeomyia smithii]XP_055550575.1 uncharacterized protein LOC129733051 [Wyeomyia smithii]XP_055550576.1 uncharacterized protein LOC129733051 [Wyeomyia smithii]XP_055550577.1 uncharacterized protein LOC129733051 [Wyeomyia smithii]